LHLYETHISVANTTVAEKFYREIVGLRLAHRDLSRDIVFLWATSRDQGMLGLWGPGTAYGPGNGSHFKQHLAFVVTLPELFRATKSLQRNGIETLGFWGGKASEPTVIGWMPSAQIYFRDPDEHVLEFIAILGEEPDAGFNGPYSEWQKRRAGQS
jgi:lactoylglutathione lyase